MQNLPSGSNDQCLLKLLLWNVCVCHMFYLFSFSPFSLEPILMFYSSRAEYISTVFQISTLSDKYSRYIYCFFHVSDPHSHQLKSLIPEIKILYWSDVWFSSESTTNNIKYAQFRYLYFGNSIKKEIKFYSHFLGYAILIVIAICELLYGVLGGRPRVRCRLGDYLYWLLVSVCSVHFFRFLVKWHDVKLRLIGFFDKKGGKGLAPH